MFTECTSIELRQRSSQRRCALSCLNALIESPCLGNFSFLFLNLLPPSETVNSNEKLRMGTDGASIKHLGRPSTAQLGWKTV